MKPKMTLAQGAIFAQQRVRKSGFKLSPTQLNTPGDGNCMVHALTDQFTYDSHLSEMQTTHDELRALVVSALPQVNKACLIIYAY